MANDVLRDLLGYSELDCIEILTSIPTEIAQSLTQQQALYLAQTTTSVYQSDGSILKSVLATLATVTIANRLSRFLR